MISGCLRFKQKLFSKQPFLFNPSRFFSKGVISFLFFFKNKQIPIKSFFNKEDYQRRKEKTSFYKPEESKLQFNKKHEMTNDNPSDTEKRKNMNPDEMKIYCFNAC